MPWSKKPLSSVNPHSEFTLLHIAGVPVVEPLGCVNEVVFGGHLEKIDGYINLRGKKLPVIESDKVFGKITSDNPLFIIINTPWAENNNKYAVAVDSCAGLFFSPVGTPVSPPADKPFAKFIRECWDNENGDPFYFMDWVKMHKEQ